MKKIDYKIYKDMQNIKQNFYNSNSNKLTLKDVKFVGSIDSVEVDNTTNTKIMIKNDIYISIETVANNKEIIKFIDDKNNVLAWDLQDGNGIIASPYSVDSIINNTNKDIPDLLTQLNNLDYQNSVSLNDLDNELDKISKQLNIPKEKILSIAKIDNPSIENNNEKDSDKNKIKIKNTSKKDAVKNNEQKNNPNIKQETDLSQKINDKYTLGDVLGVPDNGKLVCVYSDAVEENRNSTRFTFLIEDKDGNFLPCDNLVQTAGTLPTNNIYASNYDGSDVKKTQINSMYKIKSPYANENYILTCDIGAMGTIDLGFGQAPVTQGTNSKETSIVTAPLKTSSTYNTRPEVKETLNSYKAGKYHADQKSAEADTHENCNHNLTVDDVDGNDETGNHNSNIDVDDKINHDTSDDDKILIEYYNDNKELEQQFFTDENSFVNYIKKIYPNKTPEEALKSYENEHDYSRELSHERSLYN